MNRKYWIEGINLSFSLISCKSGIHFEETHLRKLKLNVALFVHVQIDANWKFFCKKKKFYSQLKVRDLKLNIIFFICTKVFRIFFNWNTSREKKILVFEIFFDTSMQYYFYLYCPYVKRLQNIEFNTILK